MLASIHHSRLSALSGWLDSIVCGSPVSPMLEFGSEKENHIHKCAP